jgi:outer membrane protein assembly factor BamB
VDGKLFSINQQTGKREWFFDRNVPILTLRGTSAPISTHGAVISGFDNGKVALFFLEDGKPIWEKRIAQSAGRSELERIVDMDAKPLVVDTRVYVVTYNGNLAALELRSGETLWQREMSSFQNISNSGARLFVTNAQDQVRALSINGGATLWSQTALKNRGLSAPVAAGDYVVAADFEGYLHWMDVTDGHFVYRQQVDSDGISGEPVVSGQQLIVLGRSGKLVSIEFPPTTYQ